MKVFWNFINTNTELGEHRKMSNSSSYIFGRKDIPIAEATYMSLYGATASVDYSLDQAQTDGRDTQLSEYNLNQHHKLSGAMDAIPSISKTFSTEKGNAKTDEYGFLTATATQHVHMHDDENATVLTHQSWDEALYELRFKRKSTADGQLLSVGQSPIYTAIFNMLAGAGVVGLPVTYKKSGLCTGIAMMVIVAALSVYTLRLQIATGKKVKCEDYEKLVSKCFGVTGYYFISFSILIFDVGACLTYTIILGNSARDVLDYMFEPAFFGSTASRQVAVTLVYVLLILPFCMGRNFSFIEKVSALAILVVLIMMVVVMSEYYSTYRLDAHRSEYEVEITWWITRDYVSILAALGTISFAFIQHDLAFLVYKTLQNNTLARYTVLACWGMLIQCVLCVVMAIYGYLSWAQHTNDDILTNYPIENVLVLAVRILYTFRMAFVFPTAFYVVRHICYAILFGGVQTYEHASNARKCCFTLIPWSAFLAIGLFVEDLGFVMSLAGLLSALNIAFVLPCLCHLKLGTQHPLRFWTAAKGQKCNAFLDTVPPLLLIVFGLLAGVTGSIGLVLDYMLH